jgi:hypothetical protein
MASLPAMQSVYGPPVVATTSAQQQSPSTRPAGKETSPALAAAAEALLGRGFAAVREWGRLRPLETGEDPAAPMGETEPAGYEEALRQYFDALGKGANEPAPPAAPPPSPAPQ